MMTSNNTTPAHFQFWSNEMTSVVKLVEMNREVMPLFG
jgi:hypothetical protein